MNPNLADILAYDARSFILRGKRTLIISGEIHYPRLPRAMWAEVLDESVRSGINCVSTYVFWGLHEPRRDEFDFSGERDLAHFVQLCGERGLAVILRLGPYACAEWNFGGYPAYLRDEPDITIRTWNPAYLARVENYFRRLAQELRPLLASRGGPVILVQVENEYDNVAKRYGREGERYLAWMVELVGRVGFDVPALMCEGEAPETASFSAEGTLKCLNGFSIGAERCDHFRRDRPDQPLFWTELWTGWYDTWGYQVHRRDAANMVYHILDFVGRGGGGWNYYMWYAGTNFGRNGMYLQTTRYGLDAPLDEFGRATPKSRLLRSLHLVLQEYQEIILEGRRTVGTPGVAGVTETRWSLGERELKLVVNPTPVPVQFNGGLLAGRSARLLDKANAVVFESHPPAGETAHWLGGGEWTVRPTAWEWQGWPEPLPGERSEPPVVAPEPIEQLLLTQDRSDYCWYSTEAEIGGDGTGRLEIDFGGDYFHLWIDGEPIAESAAPLRENRGPTWPEDPLRPHVVANILDRQRGGFSHEFRFKAQPGRRRLDILAGALGMVKGDWQIGGSMNTERKGIWQSVRLNGQTLVGWSMRPGLVGERLDLPNHPEAVAWMTAGPGLRAGRWYTTTFRLARRDLEGDVDIRLDAKGLGKGMLFINGRAAGRHWLIAANGYGADEVWHDRELHGLSVEPAGQPTQRYYHIPRGWLAEDNRLTLFDERSVRLEDVGLQIRRGRGERVSAVSLRG